MYAVLQLLSHCLICLIYFILYCVCVSKSDESNVIVDVCVLRKMQTYNIIHT